MENKWAFRLAVVSTLLAFIVILLGATTRLKEAGLACPDWPGCYGQLIVQPRTSILASQTLDSDKAWTEMIHRYAAAILVLLSFATVILIVQRRTLPHQPIKLAGSLLVLLFFQGLLGKWTVTLRLHPLVVVAHLLSGLTLLSLLWILILRLHVSFRSNLTRQEKKLRLWAGMGLFIVVVQIMLGGWTSSNYAAFVCPDFPSCQGSWWPTMNFSEGFTLWRDADRNFEGGQLSSEARTAIHMTHRVVALMTTLYLIFLAWRLGKTSRKTLRVISLLLLTLLALQVTLGTLNIAWSLPLFIAVAHNGNAALLLLTLMTLCVYLHPNKHYLSR